MYTPFIYGICLFLFVHLFNIVLYNCVACRRPPIPACCEGGTNALSSCNWDCTIWRCLLIFVRFDLFRTRALPFLFSDLMLLFVSSCWPQGVTWGGLSGFSTQLDIFRWSSAKACLDHSRFCTRQAYTAQLHLYSTDTETTISMRGLIESSRLEGLAAVFRQHVNSLPSNY